MIEILQILFFPDTVYNDITVRRRDPMALKRTAPRRNARNLYRRRNATRWIVPRWNDFRWIRARLFALTCSVIKTHILINQAINISVVYCLRWEVLRSVVSVGWLVGSFVRSFVSISVAWERRRDKLGTSAWKMFAQIYREKVIRLTANTRRAGAADWRRLCSPSTFHVLFCSTDAGVYTQNTRKNERLLNAYTKQN